MNIQTLIAIIVVTLCSLVVLRSWVSFWIGLMWPKSNEPKTGCHGCANGCQKGAGSSKLVELKRE